jgi:hypothetical protein
MSSSTDFAALEPAIVSACAQHERENKKDPNYTRCLPFGKYFVKFDGYSSFYPEVLTLKYLADLAKSDASAPRVPQVYHFFHNNGRMAYVVMEYIDLVQVSDETLAPKAAQAVRWMRSVPAPHGIVLGPKGNGIARHVVFKDREAPLDFVSLDALERYFNKVCLPDCVRFALLTHSFSFFHLARLLRSSACSSQPSPTSALPMSRWSSPSPTWTPVISASMPLDNRSFSTPARLGGCPSPSVSIRSSEPGPSPGKLLHICSVPTRLHAWVCSRIWLQSLG